MRDPLAVNPSLLMASRGVDTNDVVARWEPYVSTEPALVLARARRVLAPPGGVTLSLKGDTLRRDRSRAGVLDRARRRARARARRRRSRRLHARIARIAGRAWKPIAAEHRAARTRCSPPGSDALDQTALTAHRDASPRNSEQLVTAADDESLRRHAADRRSRRPDRRRDRQPRVEPSSRASPFATVSCRSASLATRLDDRRHRQQRSAPRRLARRARSAQSKCIVRHSSAAISGRTNGAERVQ